MLKLLTCLSLLATSAPALSAGFGDACVASFAGEELRIRVPVRYQDRNEYSSMRLEVLRQAPVDEASDDFPAARFRDVDQEFKVSKVPEKQGGDGFFIAYRPGPYRFPSIPLVLKLVYGDGGSSTLIRSYDLLVPMSKDEVDSNCPDARLVRSYKVDLPSNQPVRGGTRTLTNADLIPMQKTNLFPSARRKDVQPKVVEASRPAGLPDLPDGVVRVQ